MNPTEKRLDEKEWERRYNLEKLEIWVFFTIILISMLLFMFIHDSVKSRIFRDIFYSLIILNTVYMISIVTKFIYGFYPLHRIASEKGKGYKAYFKWWLNEESDRKRRLAELEKLENSNFDTKSSNVDIEVDLTNLGNINEELMTFEGYKLSKEEGELNYILQQLGNPIEPKDVFRSYLQKRQNRLAVERTKEFIEVMHIVRDFIKESTDLKYTQAIADLENKVKISNLKADVVKGEQRQDIEKLAGEADKETQKTRIIDEQTKQEKLKIEVERAEAEAYKITINNIKAIIDMQASSQNKKIEEVMSKIKQELKKKNFTDKFKDDLDSFLNLSDHIRTKLKNDENLANDLVERLKKQIYEYEE